MMDAVLDSVTLVEWTLEAIDGTWAMILPELKRLLESGQVSAGLRLRYVAFRAFMWAMPAKTKAANVGEPD